MPSGRQTAKIVHWKRQHEGLDTQISGLMGRAYLTPGEQQTARILKKRKLALKDRLEALQRLSSD